MTAIVQQFQLRKTVKLAIILITILHLFKHSVTYQLAK